MNYRNKYPCDDKLLWDLWLSRQQLIILAIADELHIFEAINEEIATIQLLSEHLQIEIQGIEALTCILAALGFIKHALYYSEKRNGCLTKWCF